MKEVISKTRKTQPLLPRKIIVKIKFNNFFIYMDTELATEIPRPARSLESTI